MVTPADLLILLLAYSILPLAFLKHSAGPVGTGNRLAAPRCRHADCLAHFGRRWAGLHSRCSLNGSRSFSSRIEERQFSHRSPSVLANGFHGDFDAQLRPDSGVIAIDAG